MSRKQHDKQFKLDTLKYVREHPDLTQEECCKNLGISVTTFYRWKSQYEEYGGDIPTHGSGNSKITKRRVSISGMLKHLGVSRSGYLAFFKHKPTASEKRKEAVKDKILKIYDSSKQNYGAPKITAELKTAEYRPAADSALRPRQPVCFQSLPGDHSEISVKLQS